MKCILRETKHGHKLVEMATGRLYGYVRGEGSGQKQRESERERVKEIREEIERHGFYDTDNR